MKKNQLTTFINIAEAKKNTFSSIPEQVSLKYLASIWKVARDEYDATSSIHFRCEELLDDVERMEGLTPSSAIVVFAQAVKKYERTQGTKDVIDVARREGPVTISLNSIKSQSKLIVPTNGYLEDYNTVEVQMRLAADIISCYTIYDQKKKKYRPSMTAAQCAACRIPYLDLVSLRKAIGVPKTDVVDARNDIFTYLRFENKYPFFWFYSIQVICQQEFMANFRTTASPTTIKWYNAQTVMFNDYRFKEYYIMFTKDISVFRPVYENAWKYALISDGARGMYKSRGNFSVGYYSYPLAAHYVRVVSEARDIISMCRMLKVSGVEMVDKDVTLAQLLSYNGITVLCRALSCEEQDKKTPGIYGKVNVACSLYRSAPPKPVIDRGVVKFSNVPPMENNEIRSAYIRNDLSYCSIFPSSRVSDGICMLYYSEKMHSTCNEDQKKLFAEELETYIKRFSMGVSYRNNFIFSRVPFSVKDPYRNHFCSVLYPRLSKEKQTLDLSEGKKDSFEVPFSIIEDDLECYRKWTVKPKAPLELVVKEDQVRDMMNYVLQEKDPYLAHHLLYSAYNDIRHSQMPIGAYENALSQKPFVRAIILGIEKYCMDCVEIVKDLKYRNRETKIKELKEKGEAGEKELKELQSKDIEYRHRYIAFDYTLYLKDKNNDKQRWERDQDILFKLEDFIPEEEEDSGQSADESDEEQKKEKDEEEDDDTEEEEDEFDPLGLDMDLGQGFSSVVDDQNQDDDDDNDQ